MFQVKFISKYGGKDVKEFVRRVMPSLIKDELASQYSWKGAKGKNSFKGYRICRAVLGEDRIEMKLKNKFISHSFVDAAEKLDYENYTQKSGEIAITYWLVRAPERIKNRTQKSLQDLNSLTREFNNQ